MEHHDELWRSLVARAFGSLRRRFYALLGLLAVLAVAEHVAGLPLWAVGSTLALVPLVGYGVWEVFARIRRVSSALTENDAEARLAELSGGSDEVAALATALRDGLSERRARADSDRERAARLQDQQRALRDLGHDLNLWITGAGPLDDLLGKLARATGCDAAWIDVVEPSGARSLLAASSPMDGHAHVVAFELGRDGAPIGQLGLGAISEIRLGDDAEAMVLTLAHSITLAVVARRLLEDRELRGRFGAALAAAESLEHGTRDWVALLRGLVPHDAATLELCDAAGRIQETWRISASGAVLELVPCSHGLPNGIERGAAQGDATCDKLRIDGAQAVLAARFDAGDQPGGALYLGRRAGAFTASDEASLALVMPLLASAMARMRLEAKLRLAEQFAALGGMSRMLAHEIRNPLNSMTLLAQLISQRVPNDVGDAAAARIQEHVGALRGEIARLDELVGDYMGLTSGHAQRDSVDLCALVREVLAYYAPALAAQGVHVSADLSVVTAPAAADGKRIRQLLDNVIRNALEALFHVSSRALSVSLRSSPPDWELAVRDSGPGLREPLKAFLPTYSTKPTGGGMGLALSLQIARMNGGDLVARNVAGGGAELTLTLPAAPVAQA